MLQDRRTDKDSSILTFLYCLYIDTYVDVAALYYTCNRRQKHRKDILTVCWF